MPKIKVAHFSEEISTTLSGTLFLTESVALLGRVGAAAVEGQPDPRGLRQRQDGQE